MQTKTVIAQGKDCAPPLTPKLAPWMQRFVEHPDRAKAMLDEYGSPVHLLVSSEFRRNVFDLTSAFHSRNVVGNLFFARKANKLPWLVTAAKEEGIGVDTASLREVEETLQLGVDPKKIVVTAIGKDADLIAKAISAGCLLVTDNIDELEAIQSIAGGTGKAARLGLRFSGFQVNDRTVFSRFGLPVADASEIFAKISSSNSLKLELLHAHLDRYDTVERAQAARELIRLSELASSVGHDIKGIDLGGGILMRYLNSARQWEEFKSALIASVAGERPSFTYLSDGLGYHKAGNDVIGQADLYPAWNDLSKERFLSAILDHQDKGVPLHRELFDRKLELFFEPGRALLDNVGMTIARVSFRKRDTKGNLLIGLAMNRFNLRPFRAEFCSDPILLSLGPREKLSEGAFMVGNLCSEGDIIFRRKIQLPVLPQPGDIVCFANTAGYLAHHLEVGTHGNNLPQNVLLDSSTLEINDRFA